MGTTTSVKKPLKSKRDWLEKPHQSGSYYNVTVDNSNGYTSLSLADCNRTITWEFGRPNSKRAVAKIKKIKKLIDEMYDHLVDPKKGKPKRESWHGDNE